MHVARNAKRKPKPRFYKIVLAVAAQFEPAVASAFIAAVDGLMDSIDETMLSSAIAGADLSSIEAVVGTSRLGMLLAADPRLEGALYKTVAAVGQQGADVLTEVAGFPALFNATHPNVTLFARTQAANLVVQVSEEVKEAIRIVTALGSDLGLTTAQQAKAIRQVVGLPPNWANAPVNFANELRQGIVNAGRLHNDPMVPLRRSRRAMQRRVVAELRAGVAEGKHLDPAWIAQQQEKYARNLLHRRARNIARTETLRAANWGQREGWKQAIGQGVLPADSKRFWLVTPDDRLSPEHAQIPGMNPEGRGMDEAFQTPDGPFVDPPTRTNCRCSTALMFPGLAGML